MTSPIPTWFRLAVVLMTVGGGFTGFVATMPALFQQRGTSLVIVLVFELMYACVVIAGLWLVQNPRHLMPPTIAFLLQIPVVATPLVTYRFSAGAFGMIGVGTNRVETFWRLGVEWRFVLLPREPSLIGVNLVAAAFFGLLVFFVARRS